METHLRMVCTVRRIPALAQVREASSLPSTAGPSVRGRAQAMRTRWRST